MAELLAAEPNVQELMMEISRAMHRLLDAKIAEDWNAMAVETGMIASMALCVQVHAGLRAAAEKPTGPAS